MIYCFNMPQATSYMQSKKKRKGPNKGILFVVALIIIFVVAVAWFRSDDKNPTDQIPATALPKTESFVSDNSKPTMRVGMVDQAELSDVSGGSGSGIVTREIEDNFYRHVVKANLPDLNENNFYEGWLVRPSPFDYFSTGEMIHNESGEWVLEWFGEFGQDYSDYTQVVITIEARDNNPDPADHVLEGQF